ncbi:hypothetical protein KKF61_02755, partial [Patescibacteria group bacterium]|nr:hypothetical protein [Patescibacteria group bacterium]
YFPIWWYSKGLLRVYHYCINSVSTHIRRRLALGIWLRSMFKPMYGDYTKEGRIISFGMRIVVLIYKIVAMLVWLIILLVIFIAWIILPILIIYFILYQVFDIPLFFIKE